MQRRLALCVGLMALCAIPAEADTRCNVPLSQWQTREALQQKVEAEGWKISRLKTDDGCYKVYATNAKGERVEAKYDPATLAEVKISTEHRTHHRDR